MAILPGDDAPYTFESDFPPEARGKALLDYLATRFGYQSREVWEARILAGDVLLDGQKLSDPLALLPESGRVAYVHGAYEEPQVPTDWRVLYCAETWMAVSKPAGMPVHSTPRIFRQSLVWQVRRLFGIDWSPVHRLDRDTSGLVLFARGPVALPWLNRWFSERRIEKVYLALVHGNPKENFRVDAPLGNAGDPRVAMRVGVRPDGKECLTEVRVLGVDSVRGGSWVEVRPRQGRLHQIRAHMEFAGFPIVGDLLYDGRDGAGFLARAAGAPPDEVAAMVGSSRMWLHARSLHLPMSVMGMPRLLDCPLEGVALPGTLKLPDSIVQKGGEC